MKTYLQSLFSLIFFFCLVSTTYAQTTDSGWPKTFSEGGNSLVVYQPQVDDWQNGQVLTGKAAVQMTMSGSTTPLTGVIWFKADTVVNKDERLVLIQNVSITKSSFFEKDPAKEQQAEAAVAKYIPNKSMTISLDRLMAAIETAKKESSEIPVDNNPPTIFVSKTPARLLLLDGEPLWHEIKDTTLTYAVNTNWDLFYQPQTKHYFLLDGDHWLTSDSLTTGWQAATELPDDFNKLPNDDNWQEVKKALPLKPYGSTPAPTIFVSKTPAELIVIEGEPKLAIIAGTQLSEVTNTESDLFFYTPDNHYYFLVAGRWFKSSSLEGPWTFTSNDLPGDFAKIPANNPKSSVLASVKGTPEAEAAVAEAQIPQLATVKRNELSLTVTYSGDPIFKPIPGTSLQYATNADTTVIKVGDQYFALSNGVWFVGNSPNGPWAVAVKVPDEIYQMPPSSPVYNATYVKIYNVNPATNEVVVGYTAGYLGAVIAGGVLVWGTGYYYPPYYYYPRPYWPVYYPCFHTYGMNAYYSPYNGMYYRHGYAYGPYGGINGVAVYNPATGGYFRGAAAYGPYQSARGFVAYNPTTGVHAAGYQRSTPYATWGHGVVSQGDEWARGGFYSNEAVTAGHVTTSGGTNAGAAKVTGGDLYVGKDGNVYRKDSSGSWEQWQDGGWNPVDDNKNNQNTLGSQADQSTNRENRQDTMNEKHQGQGTENQQKRQGQGTENQQNRQDNLNQKRQGQDTTATQRKQGASQRQTSPDNLNDLNRESQKRQRGNQEANRYHSWKSDGANPRSFGSDGRARDGGGGGGRRR